MALTDKLIAIGDAIRDKTGDTSKYTLDEMPTAISGIETGGGELPEEAFVITGDSKYRFAYNGWNWFLDNYKNQITTSNVTDLSYMFYINRGIQELPFDINIAEGVAAPITYMFNTAENLTVLPYIKGKILRPDYFLYGCKKLRTIPEDWGDYVDLSELKESNTSSKSACSYMFGYCYSLRSIPENLLKNIYSKYTASSSAQVYYYGFNSCYALDELKSLPVPRNIYTGNIFSNSFNDCCRSKSFIFDTDNGTPYTVSWKSQTISLNTNVGYVPSVGYITNYNSGITSDKQVKDDATYQALKDDPDWFTANVSYSRYNHDSAVETINSLPDTSAYLAEKGGTNTIKFKGTAGALTDGGAINTLTEEEIAVATAKGWTVTLA